MIKTVNAIIKQGHGVASGKASDSPFPKGTIEMQAPHFKQQGLDLSSFFYGTLNCSIEPQTFHMTKPEKTFTTILWADNFPAEDFSLSQCEIVFNNMSYKGFVYYPHPETKIGHFHPRSLIEVIAEKIPKIQYGDTVVLRYDDDQLNIQ